MFDKEPSRGSFWVKYIFPLKRARFLCRRHYMVRLISTPFVIQGSTQLRTVQCFAISMLFTVTKSTGCNHIGSLDIIQNWGDHSVFLLMFCVIRLNLQFRFSHADAVGDISKGEICLEKFSLTQNDISIYYQVLNLKENMPRFAKPRWREWSWIRQSSHFTSRIAFNLMFVLPFPVDTILTFSTQ